MTADRHQRRHSLLLGPMAEETRRSLGPLAWAALEALVTDARPNGDGDVDVADMSVRQLAERLGVAKNTAHRALTALRRAGFAEPEQSRSTTGHFAATSYRLTIDPSIIAIPEAPTTSLSPSPAPTPSPRQPSRRTPSPSSHQLSLLPDS